VLGRIKEEILKAIEAYVENETDEWWKGFVAGQSRFESVIEGL
jgi:hypothetical protein